MFCRKHVSRFTLGILAYFGFVATCFAQGAGGPAKVTDESGKTQSPKFETIEAHDEYVYSIVFSADGKTMVTAAGDNRAVLWNWPKRKVIHSLPHDAAVYLAQLRADGKQLVTSSGDGKVTTWDTLDGKKIKESTDHQNAVHCVSYSTNGMYLASIGGDGRKGDTDCRIWGSDDLSLIHKLPGHQRPAYWVGFSPNGKILVTSGGDQRINLWEIPDSVADRKLLLQNRHSIVGHDSDVYRCDFSSDSRWLATAGQDKTVKIWDLNSVAWKQSTAGDENQEAETASDESGSGIEVDIKATYTLGETRDPYYAAKFSRNGKFLATVGDDGQLRIWDTKDFTLSGAVKLSSAALYALAFTPDNKSIIAGGADGKLFVVQVAELTK